MRRLTDFDLNATEEISENELEAVDGGASTCTLCLNTYNHIFGENVHCELYATLE